MGNVKSRNEYKGNLADRYIDDLFEIDLLRDEHYYNWNFLLIRNWTPFDQSIFQSFCFGDYLVLVEQKEDESIKDDFNRWNVIAYKNLEYLHTENFIEKSDESSSTIAKEFLLRQCKESPKAVKTARDVGVIEHLDRLLTLSRTITEGILEKKDNT